jgi:hypothetical protein
MPELLNLTNEGKRVPKSAGGNSSRGIKKPAGLSRPLDELEDMSPPFTISEDLEAEVYHQNITTWIFLHFAVHFKALKALDNQLANHIFI